MPAIPRRDVPPAYVAVFKRMDPYKAVRVAAYVQKRAVEGTDLVVMALLDVGKKEGIGVGLSRAFDYMRAGRYLYHHGGEKWRRVWRAS